MLRPIRLLLTILITCFALGAAALDVQQAKDQDLVGEQRNGYLGVVTGNPSAELTQLVKKINAARRKNYVGIASKNSIELRQVESLAAEKAISKTRPGHYIQDGKGNWTRK